MGLLKIAALVPAVASGLWLADRGASVANHPTTLSREAVLVQSIPSDRISREDILIQRQIRIERILKLIDLLTEATQLMNPDQAWRIEPVLLDLTDQTLELVEEGVVSRPWADEKIKDIENSLERLVQALEKTVATEISI